MSRTIARRRAARILAVLAAVLVLGGAALPASADSSVDGLLLTGADAAYARFSAPIDECHGLELFVGYVEADRLLAPIGSGRPHFHSDVEAQLTVVEYAEIEGCGGDALELSGVRGLAEGDQVELVTLTSATLDGFGLTVEGVEGGNPVEVALTLDLAWTADGPVFTETSHARGNHAAHRTVAATAGATLTIDSVTGGDELAAVLSGLVWQPIVGLDQTEGVITHFQEIILNLP